MFSDWMAMLSCHWCNDHTKGSQRAKHAEGATDVKAQWWTAQAGWSTHGRWRQYASLSVNVLIRELLKYPPKPLH
ncbi:hypothetical protein GQ600_20235 [Phytophthora cactorum]|nr:hypothetical protein GQ600_20235 [Phytophthora cactorum]